MKRFLKLLVCLISFQAFSVQALTEEVAWKNVRDRSGIQVFNRSIEGSDFKEFMAQTTIDANLSTIIAVFDDTPSGLSGSKMLMKCTLKKE